MPEEVEMRECECGAYRASVVSNSKKGWSWIGGCRACDRIKHLECLLEADVKLSHGESAQTLRKKLISCEKEIERLKAQQSG
jgi:hypothetical protein